MRSAGSKWAMLSAGIAAVCAVRVRLLQIIRPRSRVRRQSCSDPNLWRSCGGPSLERYSSRFTVYHRQTLRRERRRCRGTDRCRARAIAASLKDGPRGRRQFGESARWRSPGEAETAGSQRFSRRCGTSGPGDNRDWHETKYGLPAPPFWKLHEIVSPHQPHKIGLWKTACDCLQGVNGEASAKLGFDIADEDPAVAHKELRCAHPFVEIGHTARRFQRILRADQPPHGIESKLAQRHFACMHMSAVRRIKRPAEETNSHAGQHRLRGA